MKHLKIFTLFCFIFFVYSCGTVKDAFTNQKKNSSDEFLVEKKSPLVMPPNYHELPTPNSKIQKTTSSNEIKDLFTKSKNQNSENSESINQNFEDNLLKKIKKN